MTSPIIEVTGLSFKYSEATDWALRDVTFTAQQREIVLLLGRSGCGKSTLALALSGIVPELVEGTVEGSVTVSGRSTATSRVSELAAQVGMVFQDPEVQLFALTVEDEVAMSLESYGVPRNEMRERVTWAMEVCGLSGMELNAPAKLSGGQKQRVAIAAVLAREPEILVFDEPTGNLDPLGSRSVYETIRRICDDRRRTIVLVEHDLAPVIDLIDRVVVLEEGQVVRQGDPRDVLRDIELLQNCGVKIPVGTEFGLSLERTVGVRYPRTPITVDEAMQPLGRRVWALSDAFSHPTPTVVSEQRPVIEFKEVTHRYDTGHKGVDGINLVVDPGEFLAICGMNGAGKTTLALHVMGLLQPTAGHVLVGGVDTRNRTVAEMARTVGLIFQNPNHQLFKGSVREEIAFAPRNIGWEDDRIERASREVLELVGLTGLEDRDPDSLSIGQKQRVAVASVLVTEPQVLILDEPTTGQDERTLEPFMRLITELNRRGMTVLMITHDMDVAMRYATRLLVMSGGRILLDGTPSEVFSQPLVLEEAKLQAPEIWDLIKRLDLERPLFVTRVGELVGALRLSTPDSVAQ
jgi:energy-coupling factor transporter ATP-binding protein EcfA2